MTDWKKEKENLIKIEDKNWWNPNAGQYVVVFLDDGSEFQGEYEGKTIPKMAFNIEVNKQRFSWSMNKGRTENSLYGQLALVGASLGTLVGKAIHLIIKGTDKRDYTVLEALPLMTIKEEVVNN